jgi:hypothetical protein
MSTWNSLISKLQALNIVASKIQTFVKENGTLYYEDEEISDFVSNYLDWYSECLSLLPEDLRERFRAEYERTVKQFLLAPTELTADPIYYEGEYQGVGEPYFEYDYQKYFYQAFFTHRQILLEASKRQPAVIRSQMRLDAVEVIERIAKRFDLVARQLKKRYENRDTLVISDEYDVQNLLAALLKLFFDDVRLEEWTPSYAGRCSRIDFLLKPEEIVVEIKKTRDTLRAKGISDELIIDKERYRSHPNCRTLIAFVFDPDRYIDNPKGLEADLSEMEGNMMVKVIINQA